MNGYTVSGYIFFILGLLVLVGLVVVVNTANENYAYGYCDALNAVRIDSNHCAQDERLITIP